MVCKLAIPPGQIELLCMNPWTKARLPENTEISRELLAIQIPGQNTFLALTPWTTVCHQRGHTISPFGSIDKQVCVTYNFIPSCCVAV